MKILCIYYDTEANSAIAVMEKSAGEPDKLRHIWQGRTGLIDAVVTAASDFQPDTIEICNAPHGIECPYAATLKAKGVSARPIDRLQRVQVQSALELAKIETEGASERELEAIARAMDGHSIPASAYAVAMAIQHKKSFSDYW